MTNHRFLLLFLALVSVITGCRKDRPSVPVNDLNSVFESFWTNMNSRYVYWDIDTTNWDRVYLHYTPLFTRLDINNPQDVAQSVTYFKQMTYGLIDSHFQIEGTSGHFSGVSIFPAFSRMKTKPDYRDPYDYTVVDQNYLRAPLIVQEGALKLTLAGLPGNVVYFSCNQFSLQAAYNASGSGRAHLLIDSLFKRGTTVNGLVIDVRNNFGGDLADLGFLIGHFTDKPLAFGSSRFKSNTGRLDYTSWIPATLKPLPGHQAFSCPIVILTDRYTVSVAEALAMAVHLLPNGKIIGERTWGATGPLATGDLFNDGPFEVGSYFTVSTSSAEFRYADGKSYEGLGFPPDIPVPYDIRSLSKGIDNQLAAALSYCQARSKHL